MDPINNHKKVLPMKMKFLPLIAATLILAGCAGAPIPVNYAPSSVKSASGSLSVNDFTYPAQTQNKNKPITSNQIRNTAMGEIKIDRDVNKFVRDAVFAELRFMGIKPNDPSKVLSGEIQEFLIDDLGYSVDWTLRIKYTLSDAVTKAVLFEAVENTQRRTAKFANAFGAMNETIKINVEQLVDDEKFAKAIN
ncbi:hypothetical protein J8I26_14670 [Herbaspirillum sp. LeCh32-8]|uniref:hypothetical protein n=1 Tax=Herbaspirillum sp. LeCh32-8 TaxID=2821356 RepID=UPI001AE1C85B|nr:hypothetical protein [Herbaspirillum sp. LeCh32-8]MBP0599360.1 hypothetical protein [Herbaspirillum sp. LeCh32-8]